MGKFTIIEYGGKDSASVLAKIVGAGKGGEMIEMVDTASQHVIGFTSEELGDPDDNN